MFGVSLSLVFLAICVPLTLAVTSLAIEGADFVNPKTGNRFQIVGIAYQPGGSSGYDPSSGIDPLSDGGVCLRDAALMQRLGINAIRVYNVNPDLNHNLCMSIFNSVGIYVAVDVNSPLRGESIDRSAPWTTYTASYLNRTFAVVEAFKSFPNTLLFFSGNEVINDLQSGAINPPYMRAVTRDLKNYISKHSNRSIPVGYSAADVRDFLVPTWSYLQCTTTPGQPDPSRVDLFALNSYSWCGNATIQTSGYDVLAAGFANSSVPVFFSEYGCNQVLPRIFTEVPALYSSEISASLSGGLVFEYTQGVNNFGIVTINSNGSAQLLPDYNTLQEQLNGLNFTLIEGMAPIKNNITPPTCSESLITASGFASSFTLPVVPPGAQSLIDHGITTTNVGALVLVTTLQVSQVVQQSNGAVISGLAISPLSDDASNAPSGITSSGITSSGITSSSITSSPTPTTTSATPAASSSKAAAVATADAGSIGGLVVGLVAAVCFL